MEGQKKIVMIFCSTCLHCAFTKLFFLCHQNKFSSLDPPTLEFRVVSFQNSFCFGCALKTELGQCFCSFCTLNWPYLANQESETAMTD